MTYLFNEFLYRPLLNLLFFIYNNFWADLGIAIIFLTIVVRIILLPLFYKSAKDQTIIQKITPQVKEIQKKYKDDKEKQVKEVLAIYKEHKVNPFSNFLLIFIQLPVMIALYKVFFKGFSEDLSKLLYSFISVPDNINYSFLGLINLNQKNLTIVIIASLAQYLQSKLLMSVNKKKNPQENFKNKKEINPSEVISKQMIFFGPILTFAILFSLPSAIGLYWLTSSVFSVIQQIIINKEIERKNERNTRNSSQIN